MIFNNLGKVIKLGRLYPLKKVYSVYWEANVNAAHHVLEVCGGRYAGLSALVHHVNAYLAWLEWMTDQGGDWSDAECIFCFDLLTRQPIGMTDCSHVLFQHSCYSTYCQVEWPGALQAKVPHVQGEGTSAYSWLPDKVLAAWLLELI
jgi:hypothetical protein